MVHWGYNQRFRPKHLLFWLLLRERSHRKQYHASHKSKTYTQTQSWFQKKHESLRPSYRLHALHAHALPEKLSLLRQLTPPLAFLTSAGGPQHLCDRLLAFYGLSLLQLVLVVPTVASLARAAFVSSERLSLSVVLMAVCSVNCGVFSFKALSST